MNFNSPDITPGDRSDTAWRQINESRVGARYLDRRRGPMRDAIAGLRRRRNQTTCRMHPFKVYLASMAVQDDLLVDPTTGADNSWLTFLVRAGRVWDKVLYGDGSDGYDDDPYSDYFSDQDDQGHNVVPIVVPQDADPYYLWIEVLKDGSPKLRKGEDPSNDPSSVLQWTRWPRMDGIHWPIAEIDPSEPYICTIRQIATCDFLYEFRETCDCVDIDGVSTKVFRQVVMSDWYLDPVGNTRHIDTDTPDDP